MQEGASILQIRPWTSSWRDGRFSLFKITTSLSSKLLIWLRRKKLKAGFQKLCSLPDDRVDIIFEWPTLEGVNPNGFEWVEGAEEGALETFFSSLSYQRLLIGNHCLRIICGRLSFWFPCGNCILHPLKTSE